MPDISGAEHQIFPALCFWTYSVSPSWAEWRPYWEFWPVHLIQEDETHRREGKYLPWVKTLWRCSVGTGWPEGNEPLLAYRIIFGGCLSPNSSGWTWLVMRQVFPSCLEKTLKLKEPKWLIIGHDLSVGKNGNQPWLFSDSIFIWLHSFCIILLKELWLGLCGTRGWVFLALYHPLVPLSWIL